MTTPETEPAPNAMRALGQNAEAALAVASIGISQQPKSNNLTIEQESLVRDFTQAYGIERESISFDGNKPEPIFHFDALMQLALTLAKFKEISVMPGDINMTHGVATAESMIRLEDDRIVRMFGSCLVGDTFYDGTNVTDITNALEVARARALRSVLRGIGFDPVRAHNNTQSDSTAVVKEVEEQRKNDLKEIHALAAEAGLVTNGDDTGYRNAIRLYFPQYTSSGMMNASERAQLKGILRGIKNARTLNPTL